MNQVNRMTGFEGLVPALATRPLPAQRYVAPAPAYRAPLGTGLGRRLSALRHAFELRRERGRARRALAHLDDRMLRDIGLSRADIGVELQAPFPGLGEPLTRDHGSDRHAGLAAARVGLWHL